MKNVPTILLKSAFLLIGFFSASVLFSQSVLFKNGKYETGLGFGPSFFLGDLGGTQGPGKAFVRDVNLPLTKLAKGAFFMAYPTEWIGIRLAINHSYLEGDDNIINPKGGEEVFRFNRNLYFQSQVTEAYLAVEFLPTVWIEKNPDLLGKIRPYGLAGVGLFHFNPKGYYYPDLTDLSKRQLVDLKPLRLEGQGMTAYPNNKEYSLWQWEIPLGIGVKYYFKENGFFGFEVLYRKTFTDYIDDVSKDYIDPSFFPAYLSAADVPIAVQLHNREPLKGLIRPYIGTIRGNPKENDAFFSLLIRLGWRLNWNNGFGTIKHLKCPQF